MLADAISGATAVRLDLLIALFSVVGGFCVAAITAYVSQKHKLDRIQAEVVELRAEAKLNTLDRLERAAIARHVERVDTGVQHPVG